MTLEKDGYVTVFEGKNDFPENFAVYQLFHPYLYYQNLKKQNGWQLKKLIVVIFFVKNNEMAVRPLEFIFILLMRVIIWRQFG